MPDSTDPRADERLAEAVRAGCAAANLHLACTYPKCACKVTPVIVHAALAERERELREAQKRADDNFKGYWEAAKERDTARAEAERLRAAAQMIVDAHDKGRRWEFADQPDTTAQEGGQDKAGSGSPAG